jgi:hypothetical protein
MPKLMPIALPSQAEPFPSASPQAEPTDLIRERLLALLGEPSDLLRVQVKPLWGSFYRANVFVGKGPTARMAHSFFLDVDDDQIVSANPSITRVY